MTEGKQTDSGQTSSVDSLRRMTNDYKQRRPRRWNVRQSAISGFMCCGDYDCVYGLDIRATAQHGRPAPRPSATSPDPKHSADHFTLHAGYLYAQLPMPGVSHVNATDPQQETTRLQQRGRQRHSRRPCSVHALHGSRILLTRVAGYS